MNAIQQREDKPTVYDASIPPLQNGDHLTRTEFERRYAAQPQLKKAELIEGVVYVPSPVSLEHSDRHAAVMLWLGTYRASTPGLRLLDNATVKLDAENEVQPDAALCIARQGQTKVVKSFLQGAPELIVEIAATSAAYDLHDKLRVYRRTGVQEYIVLLTHERETIWYRLNEGRYETVAPDANGVIQSRVFPGLLFHSAYFWADDLTGLLNMLQAGVKMPEHKAFVESLQSSSSSK
jgi:Uma2 family endonuclease